MNKKNPDNSSVLQCLLDIEKVAKISDSPNAPDVLKALAELRKALTKDIIAKADETYEAHRYNNAKITFAKTANFKENQAETKLSANACKILLHGIQLMSQDNCFLINQENLTKILNMAKKTVNDGIRELVEKGCMTKICTLKQQKPSGTVYMINPEIASVGNHDSTGFYERMTPDQQLDTFEDISFCKYGVIRSTVQLDNRTISFNHEDIVTDETENVKG